MNNFDINLEGIQKVLYSLKDFTKATYYKFLAIRDLDHIHSYTSLSQYNPY